jgi:hypothetical protein
MVDMFSKYILCQRGVEVVEFIFSLLSFCWVWFVLYARSYWINWTFVLDLCNVMLTQNLDLSVPNISLLFSFLICV